MQGYFQSAGQRVSTFFMGGGGGGGGGNGGNGYGAGYGGNQQQQMMQQQQMSGYNQQQGYGQQQQQMGGYGAQQPAYDQRGMGGGNMQGGGYGGGNQMGGMEFNNNQGMGGSFQMTADAPRRGNPRQESNLKKGMTPAPRRNHGFQCTPQLMFALIAFLIIILAGGITIGLVVSANVAYQSKFVGANVASALSPPSSSNVPGQSVATESPSLATKSPTKRPTTKAPTA